MGAAMNVYERRLAIDKDEIRRRVSDVGERVGQAVADSLEALLRRDEPACSRVILGDLPINREIRAIDRLCHLFVARHLPSAGHLRFVSSVLQMNVGLERVGDYAATIAREGIQLSAPAPERIADEARQLCRHACSVLSNAITAFVERDAELARNTRARSRELRGVYARAFNDLASLGTSQPTADLFALLTAIHRLDRVSDQAQNLCEETLFELTGETKPPKHYRVLFADSTSSLLAPLAVALARKAFPDSGSYVAAGHSPSETLAPELHTLASELGLDVSGMAPAVMDTSLEALEVFDVIVCLSSDTRRRIPRIPYNSVVLVWEIPVLSQGSSTEIPDRLRDITRTLSSEVHALMTTLRGDNAA